MPGGLMKKGSAGRTIALGKTDAGFTLVEILLAIFIFGVALTTILSSFNAVFSSVEVIDENVFAHEMARNCINRMVDDLQSVYVTLPPKYVTPEFNSTTEPHRFEGDKDASSSKGFPTLRFTSLSHLPLVETLPGGIAEIVYYIVEDDDGRAALHRSDRISHEEPLEKSGKDPVLCENLKSLVFTYMDEEGEAHEYWDSESEEFDYTTPRAVGIKLEIGEESAAFIFQTIVTLPVYRKKIEESS